MTKKELHAMIVALQARVSALEANSHRTYPVVPAPYTPTYPTWPYIVTSDKTFTTCFN
jgi:hypothetical protein